ncbi:hypothetical protein SLEP1_g1278 [Rubroshorea leprosula]|uniref:Uncharacterized protein n=1 Tax=Rubroshorea leprosula TaxID=152421 RepID=A0AAV5HK30_9ROSI|nr:hypothetical protein SLEP1_g1278 [Rubroshorea leprosula]
MGFFSGDHSFFLEAAGEHLHSPCLAPVAGSKPSISSSPTPFHVKPTFQTIPVAQHDPRRRVSIGTGERKARFTNQQWR